MFGRSKPASDRARVVVQTADGEFERVVRMTFGASTQIDLTVATDLPSQQKNAGFDESSVFIVDLDPGFQEGLLSLEQIVSAFGARPPVIVVTRAFDADIARRLLQYRIADLLVKPVAAVDLVRACARVSQGEKSADLNGAKIYSFLPAAGGVGVTTLATETAMILLRRGQGRRSTTCLVDLDFQHGACADYLDLEPRLDLNEIEPRPERLDRQLLEVMLSHHPSGLAVITAPNRPAEMRSFNAEVVTRLLDLAAANFDNVVIDIPRTWFAWTDSVLLGSDKLFVVTEMTVPGLRHAKKLVEVIKERLADGPSPKVIVNRFEQRLFGAGLRRSDIEQALGDALAGTIPNNYRLVSEAIDRGVPLAEVKAGNNVTSALEKIVTVQEAAAAPARDGASTERKAAPGR